MAQVFAFPRWRRWRHVLAPQLAPYFAAAARGGLSLVWKIVLVVELLGRPNGVGFKMNEAFQLFDLRLLLAYALPFVALMVLVETFVLRPAERSANWWRRMALEIDIAQKAFPRARRRCAAGVRELFARNRGRCIVALLGPSGGGKSTLLRIIAGLDRNFSGAVERPPGPASAWCSRSRACCPGAASPTICGSRRRPSTRRGCAICFAAFELEGHGGDFPGQLSLGLARRASLARAFAIKPELMLLDEPFASLDRALHRVCAVCWRSASAREK